MISEMPTRIMGLTRCALLLFFFIIYSNYTEAKEVLQGDTSLPVANLNLFVSNEGAKDNNGLTAESPKQSISDLSGLINRPEGYPNGMSLLLEKNSLFREEFTPVSKLRLSSFERRPGGRLPRITGMDVVRNWTATTGRSGLYETSIGHSIELTNPRYSYVMVAEIDTVLEKTNPVTAVKYLDLAINEDAAATRPGTYYTPDLTTNPVKVYIHPTNGAPGSNRYRYEVSTRRFSVNGYYTDNVTYSDLFLQTSSNGYGMLGGGDNTIARNIVFQGGGTHHFVIKSGLVDSSIFLPGPKGLQDRIAAVFYDAQGAGNVNKLTNAIFYDIPTTIYTHTNGTDIHQSLSIDKVFAFGDSTDAKHGFSGNDTDSLNISNSYAENYPTGFYGMARNLHISKTIFRGTHQSAIEIIDPKPASSQIKLDNILIQTKGTDQNQNGDQGWVAYGVRGPYPNTNLSISNSIIHARSTWSTTIYPAVTMFQVNGSLNATKNIFICDVNDNRTVKITRADNSRGKGTAVNLNSDYNVFIMLRGANFNWQVEPNNDGESSIVTLEQWQLLTRQDKHSIMLDLRKNPLGLKAVFTDPDNGDWSLNDGQLAEQVRSVGAGMTEPFSFYPLRPVVTPDPEFRMPEGFSGFSQQAKSPNLTTLSWKTFNEDAISYFEIETSVDSINFTVVDTVRASNPGKNGSYNYNHQHELKNKRFYRLKVIRSDQTFFYTTTAKLETIFRDDVFVAVYPNPVRSVVTVEHPARQKGNIELFDFKGHWLRSVLASPGNISTRVPMADLQSGLYLLRWSSGKEVASTLIMK